MTGCNARSHRRHHFTKFRHVPHRGSENIELIPKDTGQVGGGIRATGAPTQHQRSTSTQTFDARQMHRLAHTVNGHIHATLLVQSRTARDQSSPVSGSPRTLPMKQPVQLLRRTAGHDGMGAEMTNQIQSGQSNPPIPVIKHDRRRRSAFRSMRHAVRYDNALAAASTGSCSPTSSN